MILNARVLAELGYDHDRYTDGRARKNHFGMPLVTGASGTKRGRASRAPPQPPTPSTDNPLPLGPTRCGPTAS
jgi:hypothetical protein